MTEIRQTFRWTAGEEEFHLVPDPPAGWRLDGPGPSMYLTHAAVDALAEVLALVRSGDGKVRPTKAKPRAGAPWTPQEDELLRQRFAEGLRATRLSEVHERTRAAIEARLEKLGLVQPTASSRRWRTLPPDDLDREPTEA